MGSQFSASGSVMAERVPVDIVAAFSDSSSPFFHVHCFLFGGVAGFDITCQH